MPLRLLSGDRLLGFFVLGQVLGQCLVDNVSLHLSRVSAPISQVIQALLVGIAKVVGKGVDVGGTLAAGFWGKWFLFAEDGFRNHRPANNDLYFEGALMTINTQNLGNKVGDGMREVLHE
jgi:hypothetical protein